jgi:hypothetical protein
LLALWLAAFWLPLTMHCQLASLKICCVFGSCCEAGSCCEDQSKCKDLACCSDAPDDHCGVCKIVESGNYFVTKASPKAQLASGEWLTPPAPVAYRYVLPPPLPALTESTGAPPGWNRIWQFVFRTAPVPRAPSAQC